MKEIISHFFSSLDRFFWKK